MCKEFAHKATFAVLTGEKCEIVPFLVYTNRPMALKNVNVISDNGKAFSIMSSTSYTT